MTPKQANDKRCIKRRALLRRTAVFGTTVTGFAGVYTTSHGAKAHGDDKRGIGKRTPRGRNGAVVESNTEIDTGTSQEVSSDYYVLAFDDIPGERDWDYNDFVVVLEVRMSSELVNGFLFHDFLFHPIWRTADFDAEFRIRFNDPKTDVSCSGAYKLNRNLSKKYAKNEVIDVQLFPSTEEAAGTCTTLQTGRLHIVSELPCPRQLPSDQLYGTHGGEKGNKLLFDPYIKHGSNVIGRGDHGFRIMPLHNNTFGLWPSEKTPIWEAFNGVEKDPSGRPRFTNNNWYCQSNAVEGKTVKCQAFPTSSC